MRLLNVGLGLLSSLLFCSLLRAQGLPLPASDRCEIDGLNLSGITQNRKIDHLSIVGKTDIERLPFYFEPPDLQPIATAFITPVYRETLHKTGESFYMRADAAVALEKMLVDSYQSGVDLLVHSSYRAYQIQCTVFSRKVRSEMELKASSLNEAIMSVNTRSARPGESEHQLGSAVDLVTDIPGLGYVLEYQMQETPAFQWLRDHGHRYGFVMSYPYSPESGFDQPNPKTGYIYEPWHWRYIHPDYATRFRDCGSMTLKEFLNSVAKNDQFSCKSAPRAPARPPKKR